MLEGKASSLSSSVEFYQVTNLACELASSVTQFPPDRPDGCFRLYAGCRSHLAGGVETNFWPLLNKVEKLDGQTSRTHSVQQANRIFGVEKKKKE